MVDSVYYCLLLSYHQQYTIVIAVATTKLETKSRKPNHRRMINRVTAVAEELYTYKSLSLIIMPWGVDAVTVAVGLDG